MGIRNIIGTPGKGVKHLGVGNLIKPSIKAEIDPVSKEVETFATPGVTPLEGLLMAVAVLKTHSSALIAQEEIVRSVMQSMQAKIEELEQKIAGQPQQTADALPLN